MKTNTLMPLGLRGLLVAGAAAALFASLAMFARADSAPSVSTAAYNSSNVAVTSAPIGSNVYVTAAVASSSTTTPATGSVTFNRYAGTSCSGAATMQNVSLVNGAATSSSFAMTSGGISYIAAYSGDNNNVSASSSCKTISAVGSSTSVTGTLSTTTAVLAGTNVSESATLSGATANAGGSVNYSVYSNNSCTTLWGNAGSKTVTNALVASSDPFNFNVAGTYWWQATYSGDASNAPATSTCSALSVLATSSNPNPGSGSISGTVYNDKNNDDKFDSGDTGLAGFTVNLYPNAGWWGKKGNKDAVASTTSGSNGGYGFSNLADGTYSVELIEQKQNGWLQSTSDYKKLVIKNGAALAGIDFGNTVISTSTHHGQGHGDNDHDKDDQGNKGGNGNHWGWQNFWSRFGSLPWGIGKK